eukprot:CAMPEP_0196579650 /NCGR_PEP_ID=MMETSP1081-20130531/24084_1 /TAXON_ID=36882 /ORGANISM="Pyramimonas amylifera, Strain CCMP720" /LENGTH=151 /DNA_ID=CAMNT_0041899297 /DNA_START=436 /DNA_END=888 /DNA_ORIENTATION=+
MFSGIESNEALMLAMLSCAVAQGLKVLSHRHSEGKWELNRMFGSGGMPSSHSSAVVSLATSVGLRGGLNSDLFALALMFALIVMYDASGVRFQAGKQAEVLNQIIWELPPEHPVSENKSVLRDTIGHTRPQVVAGAILGFVIALLGHEAQW